MREFTAQDGMAKCDFHWIGLDFMSLGANKQTIKWSCILMDNLENVSAEPVPRRKGSGSLPEGKNERGGLTGKGRTPDSSWAGWTNVFAP